jgi:hypothetical protein
VKTGNYRTYPLVADRYLSERDQFVQGDPQLIWIENAPPSIDTVVGPDTVWIPLGDTVIFSYDIRVSDPQTAEDLDSLLMTITRPADNGDGEVVMGRFFYKDDGQQLDSLAGDGRYRAGFSANEHNRLDTPFTMTWTPVDRAGQHGASMQTHLVLMLQLDRVERISTPHYKMKIRSTDARRSALYPDLGDY